MEEKKLKLAIDRMVEEVNLYLRNLERAKIKNLPMIEKEYSSRILGIRDTMFHLGYTLVHDGKRADCGEGADPIEYMHYKAIER